ncbi:hypothetical protein Q361_10540 [Flavobacterium croceum DSM 17960]|uniref:Uncharacterized protein n=1 Tax=Flavobacterium croceum DSM 17960 TaxID=1121886 RepID=A0A2S4N8Y3_9FLAO|nr:hypothetical protein Q361_10540 [Flavobacterium croceum DSM 17960]
MQETSPTFIYTVAAVIVLHFIVGFVWLIYKMSSKKDKK